MKGSDKEKDMRNSAANALKLTKGSDPAIKDKLEFLLDDSRACPQFLPMNPEDAIVSKTVMEAAALSEGRIPISELIRKEFYFECAEAFRTAISADAGLLKLEVQRKLRLFDSLYSLDKTPKEEAETNRVTR